MSLTIPDTPVLYTKACDSSSQIEYYISQERTSELRQCATCSSATVFPLSSLSRGEQEIRWWCKECRGETFLSFVPATMDMCFLCSLALRRFTGRRFLSLPLTDADCKYLFRHLPLGWAVGLDSLPYELIRELAGDPVIAGSPIQDEWLGSLC